MQALLRQRASKNSSAKWWHFVCACFVLTVLINPAYSLDFSQAVGLSDSVGSSLQMNAKRTEVMLSEHKVEDSAHHMMTAETPCDHPACDDMSNCSDSCPMSTCSVSSLSVYIMIYTLVPDVSTKPMLHRLDEASALLARNIEPLFRPPII